MAGPPHTCFLVEIEMEDVFGSYAKPGDMPLTTNVIAGYCSSGVSTILPVAPAPRAPVKTVRTPPELSMTLRFASATEYVKAAATMLFYRLVVL